MTSTPRRGEEEENNRVTVGSDSGVLAYLDASASHLLVDLASGLVRGW